MTESRPAGVGGWLRRARKIDQYFLEEKCPFSQKRKVKVGNVKIAAGAILTIAVAFILVAGGQAEQRVESRFEGVAGTGSTRTTAPATAHGTDGSISIGGNWNASSALLGGISSVGLGASRGQSPRQYGSSQIVRAGDGALGNGSGLPVGSTLPVRLINTLLSSDSGQPVIAEVMDDAIWKNSVLIPAGTKAIGNAAFDDAAKRLQIRFHTFVYPEGDQHPVSAMALLENGSSGLPGDYHSGAAKKQFGRFFGNFVGGLADGMKDRQAGGQSGIVLEPGSVKNGVLNGLAASSLDQAKALSEGMQNTKPYLEVPGGSTFLLYLEKEYSP